MIDGLLVIVGLVGLVLGGDRLVGGATRLALATGLSPAVVGLTVVAVGTSLPELAVSLSAALKGSPDLAVGNVVGSNIYNALLILGVAALVRPCRMQGPTMSIQWAILVLASSTLPMVMADGVVSRAEGGLYVTLLVGVVAWLVLQSRRVAPEVRDQLDEVVAVGQGRAWLDVAVGCALLVAGSQALVAGASALALDLGLSERVIGLTIVAVGTSLPELTASVVASWRGHDDVAVGNVVGSNLFNLLGILGASALVVPLPVAAGIAGGDVWWLVGSAAAVGLTFLPGWRIPRWKGGLLVGAALVYTLTLWPTA